LLAAAVVLEVLLSAVSAPTAAVARAAYVSAVRWPAPSRGPSAAVGV